MTAYSSSFVANIGGVAGQGDARPGHRTGSGRAPHLVQFYDDEAFLCETVCEYVAAGLATGEPIIIIATTAHREAIANHLTASSIDVARAQRNEQLTLLDAQETLTKFMRADAPDWALFKQTIGALVRRLRAERQERPARAYGEMVDVLWKQGNRQAAIRLEQMWNDLAATEEFSLVCGYSLDGFRAAQDAADFREVCGCHSQVSPTEACSQLGAEDLRSHELGVLQQRARALEAEVEHRRVLEAELRERENDLRDFLDNAVEGIHWVGSDGIILYANKAELTLLGYEREEYVGRHISEFHEEDDVINDIFSRLCTGQSIANREARLRCKNGSIKHVLINSNALFRDGKFVHTRCFTRDITARKEAEQRQRHAEEQFRKMHEATPDGVAVLRPIRDELGSIVDFGYVYVNPVVAKDLRQPGEALIGRTLLELLPGLDDTPFWAASRRVAETGRAEVFEQRYDQHGWSGWYRNIVVSIGADVAVTYSDITDRKRAEDSLRFLAEASRILTSSLDHDTTLASVVKLAVPTFADVAACDMLGPDGRLRRLAVAHADPAKAELVQELFRESPPDVDARHGVGNVVRTGKAEWLPELSEAVLETLFKGDDSLARSKTLGLRSSVRVPLAVRGNVVGVLTFMFAESGRSYTAAHLRLAEELGLRASLAIENAVHYQAAVDASLAKDEFLAVVSHELRTPLNAILGWVHMLRENSVPEERRSHALETVERNARAQNQLIEDLLDVSRIVSGKLRLDVGAVDLASVVQRAVETIRPAAAARGISIRQTLDPNASAVLGDADRLQQVAWNLLSNAVKFSAKGANVHVVLRKHDSNVELLVRDEGRGIEPAFLPHVFERFRQADSGAARGKGGLGLGLAIVRNLVELHGGSVKAASDGLGHGAIFTVCLPISPLRLPSFVRPPALHLTAVASQHEYPHEVEGLRILIVDDEEDARDLLSTLLTRYKMQTTVAANVDEAIRLLQEQRPDIVVSDIGMPGEDGYSLIRRLRGLAPAAGGRTPAVALTAFARIEERTKALVSGFNMHVPKPVEPSELLAVLASLAAGFQTTKHPATLPE